MNFIERLEREKQLAREAEERERLRKQEDKYRREKEFEERKARLSGMYNNSAVPDLLNRLINATTGSYPGERGGQVSAQVARTPGRGSTFVGYVDVITREDGSISISGKKAITLNPYEVHNVQRVTDALEKAYKSPRVEEESLDDGMGF